MPWSQQNRSTEASPSAPDRDRPINSLAEAQMEIRRLRAKLKHHQHTTDLFSSQCQQSVLSTQQQLKEEADSAQNRASSLQRLLSASDSRIERIEGERDHFRERAETLEVQLGESVGEAKAEERGRAQRQRQTTVARFRAELLGLREERDEALAHGDRNRERVRLLEGRVKALVQEQEAEPVKPLAPALRQGVLSCQALTAQAVSLATLARTQLVSVSPSLSPSLLGIVDSLVAAVRDAQAELAPVAQICRGDPGLEGAAMPKAGVDTRHPRPSRAPAPTAAAPQSGQTPPYVSRAYTQGPGRVNGAGYAAKPRRSPPQGTQPHAPRAVPPHLPPGVPPSLVRTSISMSAGRADTLPWATGGMQADTEPLGHEGLLPSLEDSLLTFFPQAGIPVPSPPQASVQSVDVASPISQELPVPTRMESGNRREGRSVDRTRSRQDRGRGVEPRASREARYTSLADISRSLAELESGMG
ncbi:hypothetical protein KIPB_008708 [Kipferlia bialata]|uniref:Uncharacterized protein n=1 Tax=Kipferlia bialata TaxID=797122 RepID=A0A9K3GKY2_9EUKA|nr:hypothetical protein KIPB_008708 [Kipferlia bialata]|eukprot:g8708.t1